MTPDNEVGKRLDYVLGNLGIVIRTPKNAEIKNEWSYYSIPPYTFTRLKGILKFILVHTCVKIKKGINKFDAFFEIKKSDY
jgi:hypothetical protein